MNFSEKDLKYTDIFRENGTNNLLFDFQSKIEKIIGFSGVVENLRFFSRNIIQTNFDKQKLVFIIALLFSLGTSPVSAKESGTNGKEYDCNHHNFKSDAIEKLCESGGEASVNLDDIPSFVIKDFLLDVKAYLNNVGESTQTVMELIKRLELHKDENYDSILKRLSTQVLESNKRLLELLEIIADGKLNDQNKKELEALAILQDNVNAHAPSLDAVSFRVDVNTNADFLKAKLPTRYGDEITLIGHRVNPLKSTQHNVGSSYGILWLGITHDNQYVVCYSEPIKEGTITHEGFCLPWVVNPESIGYWAGMLNGTKPLNGDNTSPVNKIIDKLNEELHKTKGVKFIIR